MRATSTQHISSGGLSFSLEADRLTSVRWQGVEVIRAISAPVRDSDWGTVGEKNELVETTSRQENVTVTRRFVIGDGLADGTLLVTAGSQGSLRVDWTITPRRNLTVNRAGLSVLHPLQGVEGTDLQVTGINGEKRVTSFPQAIAPAQPATDFAAVAHSVSGVSVCLAFEGETFEMEDQRNWSDASYKTYCRPLAAPRPYRLPAGQPIAQRLTATFKGKPNRTAAAAISTVRGQVPEVLLAAESNWLAETPPPGTAYLARIDESTWSDGALEKLAKAPADIECVVPDKADPEAFLRSWAERLDAADIAPRHIVALPAAYLKSHQPEGPWPNGITPEACFEAASRAFPKARIGTGMLTNFTEFNRRPPAVNMGDYVTHANAATVHAADDRSVMQTLEAMPSIFQSARRLAEDRAYRLGLCAIAMRTNPYGNGLQSNPEGRLMTMTDTDPRQGTTFAAAYALGMVSLAAFHGVQAIALGAMAGPFSIKGPLGELIGHLATLNGHTVSIDANAGRFVLSNEDLMLAANCTPASWEDAPGGSLDSASWRAVPRRRASA